MDDEEEYDSDSTVLLTDFVDKPSKIDAKRRRMSSLNDRMQTDKHEDENTAPNNGAVNKRADGSSDRQIDKNLHIMKYLVGVHDTIIVKNECKLSKERKLYVDDDIICIDSDDEVMNENTQNISKLHGGINSSIEKENNNAKLKVLKPAAINARRATSNVFERNEMFSSCDDSHAGLDDSRNGRVRVLKPSVINARRATISFEEKLNVSVNSNVEKEKSEEADEVQTPKISESQSTNLRPLNNLSVNNSYLETASEEIPKALNLSKSEIEDENYINNKALNANVNKRLNDSDESPIVPKRIKTDTKAKRTDELQVNDTTNKDGTHNETLENSSYETTEKVVNNRIESQKRTGVESNKDKNEIKSDTVQVAKISDTISENTQINKAQSEQQISECTSLNSFKQITFEALDKQESSKLQEKLMTSEVQDDKGKSKQKKETNEISDTLELISAQHEQVIIKALDSQQTSKVQDTEGIHNALETTEVHCAQVINEADDKRNTTELQNKQVITNVQGYQIINEAHDKQDTTEVLNKQITSVVDNNQEKNKQCEQEPNKSRDEKTTNELHAEQDTSIVQNNQKTNGLYDKQGTREVLNNQITSKVDNNQEKNNEQCDQETNKGQDEKTAIEQMKHDKEEISKVRYKQTSEVLDEEKISIERQEQETKNLGNEPNNGLENSNINETTRTVTSAVDKVRILTFQVNFFRVIEEYIRNSYPESAKSLHNLIQSLRTRAKNRTVQTDIKFSCPRCDHVSTYSSNLPNNAENEENITKIDVLKCKLCLGFRKLHTSYLKRYLEKVAKATTETENQLKRPVENNRDNSTQDLTINNSLPNEKQSTSEVKSNISANNNITSTPQPIKDLKKRKLDGSTVKDFKETSTQNIPSKETEVSGQDKPYVANNDITSKKRKYNEQSTDTGGVKDGAEQNIKNLTCMILSLSKHKDNIANSGSSVQSDVIEISKNTVPDVSNETNGSRNVKLPERPNNVTILNIQDVTPRNERSSTKEGNNSCLKVTKTDTSEGTRVNEANLTNNVILRKESKQCDIIFTKDTEENGSNNKTEINCTANATPTNDTVPEHKLQSNTPSIKLQGADVESKNSKDKIAAVTAECSEKENDNKLTAKVTSKNASNKSDSGEIISASLSVTKSNDEVKENDKSNDTSKPSGKISKDSTSNPPHTEGASNANVRTANPKENDSASESTIKSLLDCFTTLKNNINTKQKEVKKVIAEPENNTAPAASTSNQNNNPDIQPACNTSRRADVQYVCPVCTCEYKHASKLLRHMRMKHNTNQATIPEHCVRRKCPFCSLLLSVKAYNNHVKQIHPERFTEIVGRDGNRNNNNQGSGIIKNETRHHSNHDNSKTSEASKYKYHCSICKVILGSEYAARQHRKQQHPEYRHQPIYKKAKIEVKSDNKQEKTHDESNVEDNTQNTNIITRGDTQIGANKMTSPDSTNSHESHSRIENEGASTSRSEASCDKSSHKTDVTPIIESGSNRDTSCNEEENASHCKDGNRDDNEESTDSGETSVCKDNVHPQKDDKVDEMINRTPNSIEEGKDGNIKRSNYVYKCLLCKATLLSDYASRKHRMEDHPNMTGTRLFSKTRNHAVINNERNTSSKESQLLTENDGSSSADEQISTEIEESTDESGSSSYYEEEISSEDDVVNVSKHTLKSRNKRIAKRFDGDDEDSVKNKKNGEKCHDEARNKESSNEADKRHKKCHVHDTELNESDNFKDLSVNGEEPASDDEAIKVSNRAVMNRKERLTTLFNDDNDSSVLDDVGKDCDQQDTNKQIAVEPSICHKNGDKQCTDIEKSNEEKEVVTEDESIKVPEHTIKKKNERISMLIDETSIQDNEANSDQELKTSHIENSNNCNPTDDDTSAKVTNISENVQREINNEMCQNKTDFQEKPIETTTFEERGQNCDESNSNGLEVNEKNVASDADPETHDDDRTEIDMIDCLLEEFDSQTIENQQNETCVDKSNNDKGSGVSNDVSQVKDDDVSVKVMTCLENIRISNITSVADKIYIFVCQECHYATDDYDNSIRHCQNHYNHIKDPVTYCAICQLKYDVSCFERHQTSHDKYLKSNKIKFSYTWLFTNWQGVFENNDIPLSQSEDIQIKSIYKSFCVKLTVKDEGPWQTALYLCAKCNTCVPPLDIERHVQQKCYFMKYPCSICDCAFLTYDMRKHHELYHENNESKLFKIIVFNDKNDESFNLKLFQAKTQKRQVKVDIFKCLCGLCFISLKRFKKHFAECEDLTNNGQKCPKCIIIRRFLPSELKAHLSSHHDDIVQKYDIKIQQITFQEETDIDSPGPEAISDTPNETKSASVAWSQGDLNIKRDMLKEESLTQNTAVESNQGDMLKEESLTQNTAVESNQGDMLKEESLTQHTVVENNQGDMLKEESLTQNDIVKSSQADVLKEELLSQNTTADPSTRLDQDDLEIKRELLKEEFSSQKLKQVDQSEDPIPIEDSDSDSDVEFIG